MKNIPGIHFGESMTVHPCEFASNLAEVSKKVADRNGLPITGSENREQLSGPMKTALCRILLAELHQLGIFDTNGITIAQDRMPGNIQPLYRRWLAQSLTFLHDHQLLTHDQGLWSLPDAAPPRKETAWQEWERAKTGCQSQPGTKAQITLLEAVLGQLPKILTGSIQPTDILFPDSSMALVEGIYKGSPLTDYCNHTVGHCVTSFLEERLRQDPAARLRIIEIGAGTGGTSAALFTRLAPFQNQVEEYCYTDISKAFLLHAEQEYGPRAPYLNYAIFNVEEPIAQQGFMAGSFDIAVATNVLHATKNIRHTIRNAKALLKGNGLLLINELSKSSLFTHLTFGLLEGWWLYDDPQLRITGSPALTPESWQGVLHGEGFVQVDFPASEAHDLGYQVIMAESDGVIRQKRPASPEAAGAQPFVPAVRQEENSSAQCQTIGQDLLMEKSAAYITKLIANTLKIPVGRIDPTEPFEKYGIDSILVVQLTNVLGAVFKGIKSTLFFEYQTVNALAEHLLATRKEALVRQLGLAGAQSTPPSPPGRQPVAKQPPAPRPSVPEPEEHRMTDIAIIGLAGRYPRAANCRQFWDNLREGRNCISEIPKDRWQWQDYFDRQPETQGALYTQWGGFLDAIDTFDPLFFQITPKEAERMDPQERFFLEESHASIEDAGYTPATLCANGKVGVFVGVMNNTYSKQPRAWSIANRVSYLFNFNGPSLAVDTACSSSLTAIHLAAESLSCRTSDIAIAGGVNLIVDPAHYLELCAMNMLSASDQCRAFGDRADGFVDGEGVGAVVLKRLSQAVADNDHIYAVIKASMINAGGKTNGYTVPNPKAQAEVIGEAIKRAGIPARAVSYLEAHGTGTVLGDPIEIAGLSRAFANETTDRQFCALGAVKSNIGHLESAAGIAGLTKVLLQMQHGQIAPSLHAEPLNPNIDFSQTPFTVQQHLADWKRPQLNEAGQTREYPRTAGISSFGAGGANAHLLIQEYRDGGKNNPSVELNSGQPVMVVLSARNRERLTIMAQQLLESIREEEMLDSHLNDLAYTLQVGRQAREERMALLTSSISDLVEKLQAFADGRHDCEDLYHGQVKPHRQMLSQLSRDEDIQQAVEGWAAKGKYGKLLDFWVKGLDFDWQSLYSAAPPHRMSLPTYPFAKERYWAPELTPPPPVNPAVSPVQSVPRDADSGLLLLEPAWQEEPIAPQKSQTDFADHLVILCEPRSVTAEEVTSRLQQSRCLVWPLEAGTAAQRFEAHATRALAEIQKVIKSSPRGRVLVQIVIHGQGEQLLFSGLNALLKTARQENPKIIGQLIECEPQTGGDELAAILAGNIHHPEARHIRYENGRRLIRQWQEITTPPQGSPLPWRRNGIYLITGGAGGLGLIFAKEISRQQKEATLILTGRSPLNKEKQAEIAKIQSQGGRIVYQQVDVSRATEVEDLFRTIAGQYGVLRGIIHAAGVVRDSFILKKSAQELRQVLAPKVHGLLHLDQASRDLPLDFFLLFSSGAGAFGNSGQSDYGAANAFMDRYAVYRNGQVKAGRRHGHTLSINWPLWRQGGMGLDPRTEQQLLDKSGMVPLQTENGITALCQGLASGKSQLLVMEGDVERMRRCLPDQVSPPLEPTLLREQAPLISTQTLERQTAEQLKLLFSGVTKLPLDRIEVDEPLESYGIDSIMINQLNQQLTEIFGELSQTLFYEFQNLEALAGYFVSDHPELCRQWSGESGEAGQEEGQNRQEAVPSLRPRPAARPLSPVAAKEREAIAIIGISGRYPQAADLQQYWHNLKEGRDCVSEIPAERWSLDNFLVRDREQAAAQGKSYNKWGGFLDNFADFDPLFFSISPREAMNMDPQERLFIECCWQVLEDAGYTRQHLAQHFQSRVGVFAGITKTGFSLYGPELRKAGKQVQPYTSFSSVANRISYLFDLHGPSMPVDTMCSSSLTAIHQACDHLLQDQCAMALAGGVNLYLHPSSYVELCAQQMLSEDGRCKSFGSGADGFVPGEGVGAVLLKPLSRAIADRDNIHGVIRASAINHGGKTNGYTVPNPTAQGELIRQTLDRAGIDARKVSYIEAHGTGTELGDPIEITGLTKAFRQDTDETMFCAIGSAKSNIGHLEAAAGIAGLTKILLQMKHGALVPSLHAQEPSSKINWSKTPFRVQQKLSDWKGPRIAGISSFGAGGANAHLLVEEYLADKQSPEPSVSKQPALVLLSAKNDEQLRARARQLLEALDSGLYTDRDLADIAFTLQVGREAMEERLALLVSSLEELSNKLNIFLDRSQEMNGLFRGQAKGGAESLALFAKDEEMARSIEAWISKSDYGKLLELWCKGVTIDWYKLYSHITPRRISLPAYPFARQRYWIGDQLPGATATRQEESGALTFVEEWLPAPLASTLTPPPKTLVCLLSGDDGQPLVEEILAAESPETELIVICQGMEYCQHSPRHYSIVASDKESLSRALAGIKQEYGGIDALFCMWPLHHTATHSKPATPVALLQGLGAAGLSCERLLVAAEFRTETERCFLESWLGFERSLAMVLPRTTLGVVFTETAGHDLGQWTRRLLRELRQPATESVLYEKGQRLVCRVRPTAPQTGPAPITNGGTYLVTGGCGGLGLLVAQHLSRKGPVNLILTGRSAMNSHIQQQITRLEQAGNRALYLQADICDRQSMEAGLDQARQSFGSLNGVFHAAGLSGATSLLDKEPQEIDQILAPKVEGTMVLDELTARDPLDFCCYFSSSAAILGDFGSCDYAVANRFQMAFARYRDLLQQEGRRQGATICINWPLWQEGGMSFADQEQTRTYLKSSGQGLLTTGEGLALLDCFLSQESGHHLVLVGQAERLHGFLNINRQAAPQPETPVAAVPVAAPSGRTPAKEGFRPEECLLQDLKKMVGATLHIPGTLLDTEENLTDFGFDSITLAEFASRLSRHLNLEVTPALFFGHSTLSKVTDYFLSKHQSHILQFYTQKEAGQPTGQAPEPHSSTLAPQPAVVQAAPEQEKRDESEPIAIIGMSGRFPGAANVEEFWQILANGQEAVTEIPADRFDWQKFYGDPRKEPGATNGKWCGSLAGIDEFDPLFFEISPKQAEMMDPRQRLLLQESWRALEDAGYGPQQIKSSTIGMFVGAEEGEYHLLTDGKGDITANHNGILAARLSYFLDLTGPNLAINTACSSGLVAAHQACVSLRNRECDTAIAAGVNLLLTPDPYLAMGRAGMLSPDGKTHAFDQEANGLVPGEAVVAVVLKRLSKARADQDPILAVIQASGVNYDGKTNGITAPSGVSQTTLLKTVYKNHQINTAEIDYIVTHGTGTKLGDPVEVNALAEIFHQRRETQGRCALTSSKTNFGHTFAASGLVSLVNLIQAMRHGLIPPSLHCTKENDYIQWQESPLYINTKATPWQPAENGHRTGAVSAFGMSGTNAHMVVRSPKTDEEAALPCSAPGFLLALSAKTPESLQEKITDMLAYLERRPNDDPDLGRISFTLLSGRHHFEERCAIVARDRQDAIRLWQQALKRQSSPDLFWGEATGELRSSQSLSDHGRELLERCDSVRGTPDQYRQALKDLAELYCQGAQLEWPKLFGSQTPRRLSLPAYPFARERCWPETTNGQAQPAIDAVPPSPTIHPLLHRNTSDLSGLCFTSSFSGQEPFLADHLVDGKRVLPGVAYLEMVRAAMQELSGDHSPPTMRFSDVVWRRPMIVDDNGIQVRVDMGPDQDGDIDFRITSSGDRGQPVVHCQGRVQMTIGDKAPLLDLPTLRKECVKSRFSREQCYQAFQQAGLRYGLAHQGLAAIHLGRDQILARLELPTPRTGQDRTFVLHPGLMDAALQGAIGFLLDEEGSLANGRPALPFALEEMEVYRPCTDEMWALLRETGGAAPSSQLRKLDIDLCDEQGRICVRLQGFTSRLLNDSAPLPAKERAIPNLQLMHPVWQASPLSSEQPAPEYSRHQVLLIDPTRGVEEALHSRLPGTRTLAVPSTVNGRAQHFEAIAAQVFEEIKALLAGRSGGKMLLQVVHSRHDGKPPLDGLAGLLKTAALENPKFSGQLIEVEGAAESGILVQHLDQCRRSPGDQYIRYRSGQRLTLDWQLQSGGVQAAAPPWQEGGVYLITGGAGGLGLIFATEIAARLKQVTLILSGRSPLNGEKAAQLERLRGDGSRIAYHQADVTDSRAVNTLFQEIIEEYGSLHGIIHAAGVIHDNFIIKKSREELHQVLAPKVKGLRNLDLASRDLPLDLFILFSSVAGAMGNIGQADYAAANGFMDSYAQWRNRLVSEGRRQGRTLSINWPLWQEGGMGVDQKTKKLLLGRQGLIPLPTASGISALYATLASGLSQVAVLQKEGGEAMNFIKRSASTSGPKLRDEEPLPVPQVLLEQQTTDLVNRVLATTLKVPQERLKPHTPFEKYGVDSLVQMDLIQELETATGQLPKTLLFEQSTIRELVEYLVANHGAPLARFFNTGDEMTAAAPPLLEKVPAPAKTQPHPGPSPRNAGQDIAIIGVSGRYPMAEDLEQLWDHLRTGRNCITEAPVHRWRSTLLKVLAEREGEPLLTKQRFGGFLHEIDRFDHKLFAIPENRVHQLSPELRLFLEIVWETFEDAGYTKAALGDLQDREQCGIGVFSGTMYNQAPWRSPSLEEAVLTTNVTDWQIANRISHFFDLTGPSLAVNSACSSSISAIHLACESLKQGNCSMAIAGGINLTLDPSKFEALELSKFLGSGEQSRSFGQGDGYIPGEGVGAVLLKPLDMAVRDNDRILALIKGSALNHGGGRQMFSAPDPKQQSRLMIESMARTGIEPQTINYVESAANGSPLGDPIEIVALKKAFAPSTDQQQFCALGSVKSNLGHLEAASGISQLTKVLLQLRHGTLVPSINAQPMNPNIDLTNSPFFLQQESAPWPRLTDAATGATLPRRAMINSFGAGGAYANLLVEEYVEENMPPAVSRPASDGRQQIFCFSAQSEESLFAYLKRFRVFLEQNPSQDPADLVRSLLKVNHGLEKRAVILAKSVRELLERLTLVQKRDSTKDHGDIFLCLEPQAEPPAATVEQALMERNVAGLAALWVAGAEIDLSRLSGGEENVGRFMPLPKYVFDHRIDFSPAASLSGAADLQDDFDEGFFRSLLERLSRGELTKESALQLIN